MKKINFLIIILALALSSYAQAPQAFQYQAIARDHAGNILVNNPIGIRIGLVEGNIDSIPGYIETHNVKSNASGIVNLLIGEGDVEKGDFSKINWGKEIYFIKIEMDLTGGSNYKEMGTSQLYAVPYALYAEKAGKIADHTNKNEVSEAKSQGPKAKSPIPNTKNPGDIRSGIPNSKLPADDNSYLNANIGNVGIGTKTPSAKLDVNGNIKTTGSILSDDGLTLLDEKGNPREVVLNPDGTLSTKSYCEGYIIDIRDNQEYNIVKIGTHCWMAENLNAGIKIDGSVSQQDNSLIEKHCYDDDENYCNVYGGLYQWDEMMQYVSENGVQGICPENWHIPTDKEWKILEGSVDSQNGVGNSEWDGTGERGFDAGGKLKSIRGWFGGGNGTNDFGFRVLPAGYYNTTTSLFTKVTRNTYFWSSSESGSDAYARRFYWGDDKVYRNLFLESFSLSLRCIKDFECGDSITDFRDGKHYGTVKIGSQCWMSQNINVGERIDGIDDPTNLGTIEKYCYDDSEDFCLSHGGLYQWNEAMQYVTTEGSQGICLDGWHIPSDDEWKILEGNVDSHYGVGDPEWGPDDQWRGFDAGKNLKSLYGWTMDQYHPNVYGMDLYGFTALPGGYRVTDGSLASLGYHGYFWTSTETSSTLALLRELYNYHAEIKKDEGSKNINGYSVRCIQDN